MATTDVREHVKNEPMRPYQYFVIGICLLITMVDGYEILIMAFVAPYLAADWGLDPSQVGPLLSAGVLGMAVGSIFISPLADRLGRRTHMILCLSMVVVGMTLSGFAQNVPQMIVFRAFAGIFIGGVVASVNVLVAEFSNDKRRGTIMGVYGVGFPAGVALGGAVTTALVGTWGWRGPFFFSAIVTAILLFIVIVAMPESVEYLLEKRPKGALSKYNKLAARLRLPEANALPPARAATEIKRSPIGALFRGILLRRTIYLWAGYALLTAAFYFANTWTVTLVADATGDPAVGVRTGVLIAVGGVIGALVFAGLSLVMRPRLATIVMMVGGAIAYVLYANNFETLGLAMFLAVLVGLFANGGIAAFYAISPYVFPAASRSTGVGWMLAVARIVSFLTPTLVGLLLASGWTPVFTYQVFAIVLLLAGVSVFLLDRTYRGRSEDPETPEQRKEPEIARA